MRDRTEVQPCDLITSLVILAAPLIRLSNLVRAKKEILGGWVIF